MGVLSRVLPPVDNDELLVVTPQGGINVERVWVPQGGNVGVEI